MLLFNISFLGLASIHLRVPFHTGLLSNTYASDEQSHYPPFSCHCNILIINILHTTGQSFQPLTGKPDFSKKCKVIPWKSQVFLVKGGPQSL